MIVPLSNTPNISPDPDPESVDSFADCPIVQPSSSIFYSQLSHLTPKIDLPQAQCHYCCSHAYSFVQNLVR